MQKKSFKIFHLQLDELYIYVDKKFLRQRIVWQLNSKNRKNAKNSRLCQLRARISWLFFPPIRFAAVNSKYSLVSHIFELGVVNERPKRDLQMY